MTSLLRELREHWPEAIGYGLIVGSVWLVIGRILVEEWR